MRLPGPAVLPGHAQPAGCGCDDVRVILGKLVRPPPSRSGGKRCQRQGRSRCRRPVSEFTAGGTQPIQAARRRFVIAELDGTRNGAGRGGFGASLRSTRPPIGLRRSSIWRFHRCLRLQVRLDGLRDPGVGQPESLGTFSPILIVGTDTASRERRGHRAIHDVVRKHSSSAA